MGVEFRAGLDEVMVESLERSFPEDVYTKSVAPPSRVRTSDGGARFTVDGAGQMIAAEVKTAVLKTNVALLAHHYDMRLCCATEQPTATTAGAGAGAGVDTWTMERLKKRTTYRRRHDPMWQVDVTEVETFTRAEVEGRCGSGGSSSSSSSSSSGGGGGGGSTDYELEFEMEAAAMKAWLTADPAQVLLASLPFIVLDYRLTIPRATSSNPYLLHIIHTHPCTHRLPHTRSEWRVACTTRYRAVFPVTKMRLAHRSYRPCPTPQTSKPRCWT